ncbi:hypothetical protein BH24DEI2_BH24DEI2_11550 [soil metagenome]
MKIAILRVVAWLALIGGIALALASIPVFFRAAETLTPWWLNLVHMLYYLVGGVVVWALFSTIADNAEALRDG